MKSTDAPSLITTPFAQNGTRNDIPASDPGFSGDDAGRAAFATGFPDITMRPITAGGKPPFGADFNGILYALSSAARYYGAGGHYRYNGNFAAAIGGYPIGATVQASDGMGHWLNVVDANGTDPESALSTGWIPLSDHNGTATVNLTGNVSLSASQAAKANIRLTGSIKGNLTVTFPAWTKRYSIINDCTGDQSVICTTGNGESISIKNGAKYEIGCDGKNLTVATVNASQVFAEPNKNVSSLDAPTVQQVINALGSAAKHNEGDFERTGVAVDLDRKLWNAVTENFDSKGSADTVQRNLDLANKAAWEGINGAWEKANDAQGRCGHLEYFLHGSDDRAFVYVGDPTGDGILFKQEAGWWSWIYQHQTKMEVTPEGKINYATIGWGQVTDKYVVGEGDETGLVHMNGSANIWDVNAKNYAASQYQARQAQETGAASQKAADAVATRVTTLEPAVAENKALVRANWNREMLYVGSSDKQNGWFLAFEAGYVNIYWKGVRFFQIDPDKRIKDATISVGQVEGRAEWGDNWFLDKQSGKLWQWGKVYNGGEREAVVRFPRAFRDNNYAIMSMDIGNGGGWHNSRDPQSWGVTLRKNGANNDIAGQWIAFGNG